MPVDIFITYTIKYNNLILKQIIILLLYYILLNKISVKWMQFI